MFLWANDTRDPRKTAISAESKQKQINGLWESFRNTWLENGFPGLQTYKE